MQFVIIANDYTDDEALNRRMKARPDHFKHVRALAEQGHFLVGGAILDDNQHMIGSVIIFDFPSRQALDDQWMKHEPYIQQKVWEHIQVLPYNVAMLGQPLFERIHTSLTTASL